jgi:hypothetical protein
MQKDNQKASARIVSLFVAVLLMTGFGFAVPTIALADSEASALQFVVVSDDIRKDTTAVARGAGSASSDADSGKSNNGHGNNADGVDSSNPGQGGGGPNGAVDPSGSVDDEAGGGGASPSKSNNGKNK